MNTPSIPKQTTGSDHTATSERCFPRNSEAKVVYGEVLQKLLDVANWKEYARAGANFRLFNKEGESKSGPPSKYDYIRTDIPGPGNVSGKGYD